jgi:tetratricopeptide (TPR) repeat protein/DNA-binding CsgD family transcriptional regulator
MLTEKIISYSLQKETMKVGDRYNNLFFKCLFILTTIIVLPGINSYTQEIEYSDSLLITLENKSVSGENFQLFISIANSYIGIDNEKALQYARSALMEAENKGSQPGIAEAYQVTGAIYESKDQYNLAIENYMVSYQEYADMEDETGRANLSYNLANVYKKKGFYERSFEKCLEGLGLYESLKDSLGLSNIYVCMGSLYKYQSDPAKSIEYYNKALEIRRIMKDTSGIALCLNNIGVVYSREGNSDLARDFYERSLSLFTLIDDKKNQAILYNNISNVLLTGKEFDLALDYMTRSLKINNEIGYTRGVANQYESLGRYYLLSDDTNLAIDNYLKAFDLYKGLGRLEYEKTITERLSSAYYMKGDYKNAYSYLSLNKQYGDSLFNVDKMKNIATLEFEFKQLREKEEHARTDQRTRWIISITVVILLFTLIIIVLLFSRQRIKIAQQKLRLKNIELEKGQIELDLQQKQKELAAGTIYRVRKNEILNDIITRLRSSIENLKDENIPVITNIIEDLSNSTDSHIWDEFEVRFLQVHQGFYENITSSYPDLTTNEKRISAFIRLDLSTKEISAITNQTPHSINIARTRLRKKLGLANTDTNLSSFLSQF